jgi:hypothetical protein
MTGSIDDSADNSTYRTHGAICLTVRQGSRQNRCCISVFEAANTAAEAALYVLPHPLDHARFVVAVGKIMIQRGEAVLLAGLLHIIQLITVKREPIDVAPIKESGVHGKAWCHGSVRSDDHAIVPGTVIPFAEAASKCRSAKSSPLVAVLMRSSE